MTNKPSRLSKQELLDTIYETLKKSGDKVLTKKAVRQVVDAQEKIIAEGLARGEIYINSLGTFRQASRAARKVRNPQNGEFLNIPERNSAKFKPSKQLKELLN